MLDGTNDSIFASAAKAGAVVGDLGGTEEWYLDPSVQRGVNETANTHAGPGDVAAITPAQGGGCWGEGLFREVCRTRPPHRFSSTSFRGVPRWSIQHQEAAAWSRC